MRDWEKENEREAQPNIGDRKQCKYLHVCEEMKLENKLQLIMVFQRAMNT